MRIPCFFLLLFSIALYGQDKPLDIRITSLKALEDSDIRTFELVYTLSNQTDRSLSFFFSPGGFGGAMSNKLYYKCYQDNEFLDSGHILQSGSKKRIEFDLDGLGLEGKSQEEQFIILKQYMREKFNIEMDGVRFRIDNNKDSIAWIPPKSLNRNIMQEAFTIAPKEVKTFTDTLYWDKKRYFTVDPHEYYIDENSRHDFEITLVLMKELLKDKLSEGDLKKIMADKDFIKGVFISNKVPIDFGK